MLIGPLLKSLNVATIPVSSLNNFPVAEEDCQLGSHSEQFIDSFGVNYSASTRISEVIDCIAPVQRVRRWKGRGKFCPFFFREWAHLAMFPVRPEEIEDETDPRAPVRRPARLLFTRGDGRPIHRADWSHIWRPAVERAGLPAGYGLRDLRHYFATVLIYGGANVKTVQLATGHTTPTVTLNTYVGHWPDAVDQTRTLLDSALGCTGVVPTA